MRKIMLFLVLLLSIGCTRMKELVGANTHREDPTPVKVISDAPTLPTEPPEFGIPVPEGTIRAVSFGRLPDESVIKITGDFVDVFLYDPAPKTWFKLGNHENEAFWYTFNPTTGDVTYHGRHLENKLYCIYAYIYESR